MDEDIVKGKSVAVSNETHTLLIELKKELKLKTMDKVLAQIAGSYKAQRQ